MTSLIETFPSLWKEINPTLLAYRTEAKELREATGEADIGEDVQAIHERLIVSRRAQDRLEAITADVGALRARCRKLIAELEAAYEDAWREAMMRSRTGEYSSAKEKDASHQAGAINELIALRKAQRIYDDVAEVYDYIYFKYRGLDSSRRELDTRIRLLNVASQLER